MYFPNTKTYLDKNQMSEHNKKTSKLFQYHCFNKKSLIRFESTKNLICSLSAKSTLSREILRTLTSPPPLDNNFRTFSKVESETINLFASSTNILVCAKISIHFQKIINVDDIFNLKNVLLYFYKLSTLIHTLHGLYHWMLK